MNTPVEKKPRIKFPYTEKSVLPRKPFQSRLFFEPTLLNALVALLSVCLIITLVIRYRLVFMASSDIGGIESNVIYSIQRYMAGFPLYANPEVSPYSITQYSPLYYRIVALFGFLLDIDPDYTLGIYRLSRVISLSANVLYALLVFSISVKLFPNVKVGLCLAITAFVLLPPQSFSRPDSIYIVMVMGTLYAGLLCVQATTTSNYYRWLVVSIIVSALSIATKQSGIALPFILAGYSAFFRGKWIEPFFIGLSSCFLALLFLLGLMPEHDPLVLYANVVTGVSQGLDWASFKLNIVDHFFRTFTLHNAIGLPLCIWLIRQPKPGYTWLGWFVLGLFGFSLSTSLKSGSALNYFTEYIALTGLVITLWIRHQHFIVRRWNGYYSILCFSAVFWAVVPNIINFNWPIALERNALSERPYLHQKEVADYVKDSLNLKPTDKVFITNHNYCFLNGLFFRNCILPQQEIVTIMYPSNKLDYSAFDTDIQQHNIRILITRPNETTTFLKSFSTSTYKLRKKFPDFNVYESI
jgi:hypothetical protein